jgi:hypothetical protein
MPWSVLFDRASSGTKISGFISEMVINTEAQGKVIVTTIGFTDVDFDQNSRCDIQLESHEDESSAISCHNASPTTIRNCLTQNTKSRENLYLTDQTLTSALECGR